MGNELCTPKFVFVCQTCTLSNAWTSRCQSNSHEVRIGSDSTATAYAESVSHGGTCIALGGKPRYWMDGETSSGNDQPNLPFH